MDNDKLIICLIVLFVLYKLFINKESFRFATGQVNYGTIDIYAVDTSRPVASVAANPLINNLVVSSDISSIQTVPVPAPARGSSIPITISSLSPNFDTTSLSVTCHSVNDWRNPNKKLINNNFGDNIRLEYDRRTNRLELSGITFSNLKVPVVGFPKSTQPVLIATLVLTWIK